MRKRLICTMLAALLLFAFICPASGEAPAEAAEAAGPRAAYEFNPHLYIPLLAQDVPQDWWDSFYNLCDALRAGESTFACSSAEAYKWATSDVTLTELFPPACTKVKGESRDGSVPYENGVGRIYYQMPVDEYVARQAEFEALVEDVLNTTLGADDDDFEKCLKLFDFISANYTYDDDYRFDAANPEGANYQAFMTRRGQCQELASNYAYFLLQAGVEALHIGCNNPDMAHSWTYLVIGGKGYHSDPTWSLRSTTNTEDLILSYFMMNGDRRAYTGCAVDDLTAPLLPRYWANFSAVEFTAEDTGYCFPMDAFLASLDEDSKTVRYLYYGEENEFTWADQ